jgi:hypothetical protein
MAKKRASHSRMTITVPSHVRRRMAKLKDPINWSAVASDAFERKCNELDTDSELKLMSPVIQRLRSTKSVDVAYSHEVGKEFGRRWAEKLATARELANLEEFVNHRAWSTFPDDQSTYTFGEQLMLMARPECNTRKEMQKAWESAIRDIVSPDERDESGKDSEFVRGFARGAVDLWLSVKEHI